MKSWKKKCTYSTTLHCLGKRRKHTEGVWIKSEGKNSWNKRQNFREWTEIHTSNRLCKWKGNKLKGNTLLTLSLSLSLCHTHTHTHTHSHSKPLTNKITLTRLAPPNHAHFSPNHTHRYPITLNYWRRTKLAHPVTGTLSVTHRHKSIRTHPIHNFVTCRTFQLPQLHKRIHSTPRFQ